jgi:hypothetical protein
MFYCAKPRNFTDDFNDNMAALNLPAPKYLFESVTTAAASLVVITKLVETLGTTATVAEVIGAGLASEQIAVIGSALGAGYVGALIGSFIVAVSKDITCGVDLFDAIHIVKKAGIAPPWVYIHLAKHPELYDPAAPARATYGLKVKQNVRK